jgi:hypothetical protein
LLRDVPAELGLLHLLILQGLLFADVELRPNYTLDLALIRVVVELWLESIIVCGLCLLDVLLGDDL